jgi:A/G-specific adenine glycosylase
VDLSTSPAMERAAEDASRYGCEEWRAWPCWIQTYSHRRERVFPVALHLDHPKSSTPEWVWVEAGKLQGLPMGKRDQRLRDLLASPSGESALSIPLAPILHALCPDGAIQAP